MGLVVLKKKMKDGAWLQATFAPSLGMNLLSLKKDEIEVIEQSTKSLLKERFAGLGSLIGPHFHHRAAGQIPSICVDELFPHVLELRKKGILEPFSHGIARYVPWQYQCTEETLSAKLQGSDLYKGISLASLEGFDFRMCFEIKLTEDGLFLDLSIESEKPSLVGFHYYYALPASGGRILAPVEAQIRTSKGWEPIPSSWLNAKGDLDLNAKEEFDIGFMPKPGKEGVEILFENIEYFLKIAFQSNNSQDVSWQLYRPKEAPYICIEPLSSKNPKSPSSCQSSLQVQIKVDC